MSRATRCATTYRIASFASTRSASRAKRTPSSTGCTASGTTRFCRWARIRSAASVPDPQKLRLTLKVNGKTMQDGNTGQMIFSVAALVSILSTFTTLEPGDILSTGTPSGVGHARRPPVYLRPKDVVEAEIEGIGILRNPVESEKK